MPVRAFAWGLVRVALGAFGLGWGAAAFAAPDPPAWVMKGRAPDKTYKYYVGRSSGAPSEQAGFNEATREAYEQAIRENFGFQTRIQSDAYETSKDTVSTKRVQVLSEDIRLFGFEQVEFFRTAVPRGFDVWVLYRYPMAEVTREKARLQASGSRGDKGAEAFSQSGSSEQGKKSGILEVVTDPPGATVYVDGEAYGKSPVRLLGAVPVGQHRLRLDHPSHETVEQTVVMVPGQTLKVEKVLVPALSRVNIETVPSNASVAINGQPLGTTPLSGVEVPANQGLKLEITHAQASVLATELWVPKGEYVTKRFELPLKPATLAVRTQPVGAEVFVDAQPAGRGPTAPKSLAGGRHEVVVRLKGYRPERRTVVLEGGEKRTEFVELAPSVGGNEPEVWKELNRPPGGESPSESVWEHRRPQSEARWMLSVLGPMVVGPSTVYPGLATVEWGVGVSFFFNRRLGLELGYGRGSRTGVFADGRLAQGSDRARLGLTVNWFEAPGQQAYVLGEGGYVLQNFEWRPTGGEATAKQGGQWWVGVSTGYRAWWGGTRPELGLGVRVGLVQHFTGGGLEGALGTQGGVEWLAAF